MMTAAKQYEKHIKRVTEYAQAAEARGNEQAARSYREQADFWRKQLAACLARQDR